ncbi:CAS/CSE protein [Hyaloraphidium curvatum]|nr:CAS/CSE protein [Hyaloraphidium curvatum]
MAAAAGMEPTEQNLAVLAGLLSQTLDPAARKQAEASLASAELSPGFSLCLVALLSHPSTSPTVRHAAVLYFKNLLRKHYAHGDAGIPRADREEIKARIIDVMAGVPANLQVQLSESVAIAADADFPEHWPGLVPGLVAKLGDAADQKTWEANVGVLRTAHGVFARWRAQVRTDALFLEIKHVLQNFAEPYLALFQSLERTVDSNPPLAFLKTLFDALLLLLQIFWDLNCQDLPEFFENNMPEFMRLHRRFLLYTNPALEGPPPDEDDEDEDEDPVTKCRTAVCENIDLYARRYEEDFPQLEAFVGDVWGLLTTVGRSVKYDNLVSKAINFLTSVARPARHSALFAAPETLQQICSLVVLPNITLRASDVSEFQEEPLAYFRREVEGTDADSRRRAATELVRGLMEHFEQRVTEVCGGFVTACLQKYEADRKNNWMEKDTAMYLIMALGARAVSERAGATRVNPSLPFLEVLHSTVLPDLRTPPDDPATHPLIKAGALKYVGVFRGHVGRPVLLELLPLLVEHLGSRDVVVYSYAAWVAEKVLAMRESGGTGKLMFGAADISGLAGPLLTKLFGLIDRGQTPEKLAENDVLMKCVLRVVITSRTDLIPLASDVIAKVTQIISAISRNPSNPKFNHYAFETLGALVRYICPGNPAAVAQFQELLFPPFREVLANDVQEFMPYVFQILSQLLSFNVTVPEDYLAMLPPLLTPALWEAGGNVPALVGLLSAYLEKGAAGIVQRNQLPPFLGIFQKLIASKVNDVYGFDLLSEIFWNVPTEALQPFLKNIFALMLTRLQTSKTARYVQGFLNFVCLLVNMKKPGFGPTEMLAAFDALQPNLFHGVMQGVLIPHLREVVNVEERKAAEVAMTTLMSRCPPMLEEPYLGLWPALFSSLASMLEVPVAQRDSGGDLDEELARFEAEEAGGYQASFARLATVGKTKKDPVADVADPKAYFAAEMAGVAAREPAKFQAVLAKTPEEDAAYVRNLVQAAGGR